MLFSRKDSGIKSKQNWVWPSFWDGSFERQRTWSKGLSELLQPQQPTGSQLWSRRDFAYLHNVFFFHPGRKREALTEYLKQHWSECIVLVSLHLSNTLNVTPPKQLLVSLWAQKEKVVFSFHWVRDKESELNVFSVGCYSNKTMIN